MRPSHDFWVQTAMTSGGGVAGWVFREAAGLPAHVPQILFWGMLVVVAIYLVIMAKAQDRLVANAMFYCTYTAMAFLIGLTASGIVSERLASAG